MRAGKIVAEFPDSSLAEISRRNPDTEIELYLLKVGKKRCNALISIKTESVTRLAPAHGARNDIQKMRELDFFESKGIILDRAFYLIGMNGYSQEGRLIQHLLKIKDAYFPTRIVPIQLHEGVTHVYGFFVSEESFSKCIRISELKEKGIIREEECDCFEMDKADDLHAIPTIFDSIGLDDGRKDILLITLSNARQGHISVERVDILKPLLNGMDSERSKKIAFETLKNFGFATAFEIMKVLLLN